MSDTITIRLGNELAAWLELTAARTGLSRSQLIRAQLEKARAESGAKLFMRLAGVLRGCSKDLSIRRGFSNK